MDTSMSQTRLLAIPAFLALLAGAGPAAAQTFVQCESREYQYQFCPIPQGATRVTLVEQRSRSACIEGRSWGWDRRGVWVTGGCDGVFDVVAYAPPPVAPPIAVPGGGVINCASRNYQQEFCPTGPINGAMLVQQRSQAPCVQGQTWGVRGDGIWVSGGCEGDFQVQAGGYYAPAPLPAPTRPGLFVCESRNYGYNVCSTGRVSRAQLVRQISQAPCIEGSTWGAHRDGIWVDRGCEGEFEVQTR
jgi:hypothetical protein